jgi:pyruvate formate lyase activating enzyme
MTITGRIHSIETCGTLDGPGIRFVIFTQGCPLRCLYCHNPDCRYIQAGHAVTVDELIQEIQKYTSYLNASGGGVTVSGGEPLMQPHFVAEIFRQCQAIGVHTTLDTSGYCDLAVAQSVIAATDLVLLDVKSFDPETYIKVTSVPLEPTLDFARYLSQIRKPTWIRFVLVPGLTDDLYPIQGLADFVASLENIERVEILPFHKMGEYKWEQLGIPYQLSQTQPPDSRLMQKTVNIFKSRGIPVIGA